jgi:hypothetical protein
MDDMHMRIGSEDLMCGEEGMWKREMHTSLMEDVHEEKGEW